MSKYCAPRCGDRSAVMGTSIGSPSAVPVPCASSALPYQLTDLKSRRCDAPFGAVRLALGPSCYTPEPVRQKPSSDFASLAPHPSSIEPANTSEQHPSPRQYPSARLSSVWHRPSADSIPAIEKASVTPDASNPTPAADALRHSASLMADAARWVATRDDEQAVSSDTHGPVSPSVYETRPEAMESAPEVPEYTDGT